MTLVPLPDPPIPCNCINRLATCICGNPRLVIPREPRRQAPGPFVTSNAEARRLARQASEPYRQWPHTGPDRGSAR